MRKILRDSYGRSIRDLRISLTDRCNFRCFYCLPEGEPAHAHKESLLTFEELFRVSKIFVEQGIEKIRLTGGEPLLRKDIENLISQLSQLKTPLSEPESQEPTNEITHTPFHIPHLLDLALTTNGVTFSDRAASLKHAGLDRVTISLDSLKRENFERITGVDALERVLSAIDAARLHGFSPIKINAVIVRGYNDDEVVELAGFARENRLSMRFIEFMPLDSGHDWKRDQVVSGKEIREAINAVYPLKLKENSRGNETAWRYEFADGAPGEIGIIAPVTEMFCGECSRIRLTADGQIRTCLFSTSEHNLRDVLRSGASDDEIARFIEFAVEKKEKSHRINEKDFVIASRSMSFIGG